MNTARTLSEQVAEHWFAKTAGGLSRRGYGLYSAAAWTAALALERNAQPWRVVC